MQMYLVGGACRDQILGRKVSDFDYSVELSGNEDGWHTALGTDPFLVMVSELERRGFTIFLSTPEHLTVRAQFPKGHVNSGQTADFVLARKEGVYTDGRRPDSVEPGTLMDDLARRDFSMNAIAQDSNGSLIDPFNGQVDIAQKIIRSVGVPFERLNEDALRAVRALRFSVTLGFTIAPSVAFAMESFGVLDKIENNISDERISNELSKMFRFDTVASVLKLNEFPALTRAMFSGSVSLDSTMKTRGRGKQCTIKC